MNDRKNSVLLYTDDIEILEDLTLEQRGLLFTAILSYQAGAEIPEMDCATKIAFKFMRKQIDNNNKAYESACEQRKKAVASRWAKKKENETAEDEKTEPVQAAVEENTDDIEENAENENACFRTSSYNPVCSRISSYNSVQVRNTKNTDKDNDKENDNDIDTAEAVLNARDAREKPPTPKETDTNALQELNQNQINEIISKWNANKCTQNIDRIGLMSARYDNTRRCVNLYGYDDYISTIVNADGNKWFSSRGNPVTYDWYSKPDNYQKVHDGNYKQLFRGKNNFLNFEQRSANDDLYADLEKVIFD